ncbi:MAG: hypothetical protein K0S07_1490 [Chlamydiales bacterium]|jgi:hypothetical protein|nr:hypothetical protein [Chlamydiales bacterium]
MQIEEESDFLRKLNELTLQYGRKQVDADTQLLQGAFGHSLAVVGLEENFLWALSLLKSRVKESIEQAKGLIERLLYFQNELGNFPRFLHDFPFCRDWSVASRLLPIMCQILKYFSSVIGSTLRERMIEKALLLLQFALRQERSAQERGKLYASQVFFGRLLLDQALEGEGLAGLDSLFHRPDLSVWSSKSALADALTALYLVYGEIAESPYRSFWSFYQKTYSAQAKSYIGPSLLEERMPVGLYDLYAAMLSKSFSSLPQEGPALLSSALLQRTKDHLFPLDEKSYSLESFLSNAALSQPIQSNWRQMPKASFSLTPGSTRPFSAWLGSPSRFLSYQGMGLLMRHAFVEGGVDLTFLVDQTVERQPELNRALVFHLKQPHCQFQVNGLIANTFSLGDEVEIFEEDLSLKITFDLIKGKGHFLGHLTPAAQEQMKRLPLSSDPYDWQLFLRVVRLECPSEILVRLRVLN